VPEIASRQHLLAIIPVVQEAMKRANISFNQLKAISVTNGPGLAGSLLVGVNTAKALSIACQVPLVSVNHLEGHIYAGWLTEETPIFPLICLIVSGGHTDLVLVKDHGSYVTLGRTRDDAAGEAFDKAARILGLGYPGGPAIDKAAQMGIDRLNLPRAWLKDSFDFSFSGLKTSLFRLAEVGKIDSINDAAASFQSAVIEVLVNKTIDAGIKYRVKQILIGGGVAANSSLRQKIIDLSPIPVVIPPINLCTDNAAIIAACGYYRFIKGNLASSDLDAIPNLKLT
jgi:N6-L-threonylcarbamoyladenine synthase